MVDLVGRRSYRFKGKGGLEVRRVEDGRNERSGGRAPGRMPPCGWPDACKPSAESAPFPLPLTHHTYTHTRQIEEGPVPQELAAEAEAKRTELIETVSEVRAGGGGRGGAPAPCAMVHSPAASGASPARAVLAPVMPLLATLIFII